MVETASFDSTLTEWLASDGQKYAGYLRPENINSSNPLQASMIPCSMDGQNGASTEYKIRKMEDSRLVAAKYPAIAATSYNYTFLFIDGLNRVKQVVYTNIGLAILAVLLLITILLGNFLTAMVVGIMICMIDIEILLLWYAFGDTWNFATGITLVVAVGLSVDPLAHIAHSFLRTSGTGDERASTILAASDIPSLSCLPRVVVC